MGLPRLFVRNLRMRSLSTSASTLTRKTSEFCATWRRAGRSSPPSPKSTRLLKPPPRSSISKPGMPGERSQLRSNERFANINHVTALPGPDGRLLLADVLSHEHLSVDHQRPAGGAARCGGHSGQSPRE